MIRIEGKTVRMSNYLLVTLANCSLLSLCFQSDCFIVCSWIKPLEVANLNLSCLSKLKCVN